MLTELVTIAAAAKAVTLDLKEVLAMTKHNSLIELEIKQFITSLNDNIDQLKKQPPKKGGSWALAIENELNEASSQLKINLKNGNFVKYWTAKQTKDELESLRRNLIDKIQLYVSLAAIEVVIDTNDKMDEFLPSMEELFAVSSAQSRSVTMASIRTILQPMVVGMRRQDPKIEEIISLFRRNEANVKTSPDVQKFLADVLATLQTLTEKKRDDFLDPITMHLMTDPVKCFDGRTYDRFSVLRYNMTQETPLEIACDDLDVRECLFEKFDGVQAQFEYLRTRYRDEALMLANEGHSAEALSMLKNVLQWAPNDEESREKSTKLEQELAAVGGRKEFKPHEKGLPTHLDSSKCSPLLTLSTDKLSAQNSGSPKEICTDAGAVQGNCPIPDKGSFYYFELSVINQGHLGRMSIGFADQNFKLSRMPGWEPDSYGYHGDDGKLYHGYSNVGDPFGPTFTTGDTVGAGIHYATQELFFTKNGKLVGRTAKDTTSRLYPTIGMQNLNAIMVDVNFGQDPFICDVDALLSGILAREDLPTHVNPGKTSPFVMLSPDKLSFKNLGRLCSVQGNCPVPHRACFYYFEISVRYEGEQKYGFMGIGYADEKLGLVEGVDGLQQMLPGLRQNSCGYNSNGYVFVGRDRETMEVRPPPFDVGDTVGAGIYYPTQAMFFTRNGHFVATTALDKTTIKNSAGIHNATQEAKNDRLQVGDTILNVNPRLYPSFGTNLMDLEVAVNFGQNPFKCDVRALNHNSPYKRGSFLPGHYSLFIAV